MSSEQLLNIIKKLPENQQASLAQEILINLKISQKQIAFEDTARRTAAEKLRGEYCNNSDLTAFQTFDSEPFYEMR